MRIYLKAKLKGEKEIEIWIQANSGSDFVVLPRKIIEEIKPRKIKQKIRSFVVGGEEIESPLYEVKIEVEDPKKKIKRSCKAEAIMVEEEMPLLSHEAMGKLGLILDLENGTYKLK